MPQGTWWKRAQRVISQLTGKSGIFTHHFSVFPYLDHFSNKPHCVNWPGAHTTPPAWAWACLGVLGRGNVEKLLTLAKGLQLQGGAVRPVVDRRRGGRGGRGWRRRSRSRGGGGRGWERGGGQGWGGSRGAERPDEEDVCSARFEIVDADPCGSGFHSRITLILLFLCRQRTKAESTRRSETSRWN